MAEVEKAVVTPEERAEQVDKVIELIESGMSENAACKEVGINRATFRNAALRNEADSKYARALFGLAQDQVEKIEVTIDELRSKKIDPQTARVILDNRRWFASKFLPRRYGERLEIDGKQEITHKYEEMDDDQLEQLIKSRKDTVS